MSSISQAALSCCNTIRSNSTTHEESSWTMYFEDFMVNNHNNSSDHEHTPSFSSGCDDHQSQGHSSSSPKYYKLVENERRFHVGSVSDHHKSCNRLSFKKKKTQKVVDDALEDTASSPVHSPKVSSYLYQHMGTDHEQKERASKNEEKGSAPRRVGESSSAIDFIGRDCDLDISNGGLKKKGLCLVPMSMAVNYFG